MAERPPPLPSSLNGDGCVHHRMDHAVELVRPGCAERDGVAARQRRRVVEVECARAPEAVAVELRRQRGGSDARLVARPSKGPGPWNVAASWFRYEVVSLSLRGSPGPVVAVCVSNEPGVIWN